MIIDLIKNWKHYARGNELVWVKAFQFIENLHSGMEPDKHIIEEGKLFAMIQAYETSAAEEGIIEIHYDFLDIHVMIFGEENMFFSPTDSLKLIKDYTPQSDDVVFEFDKNQATNIRLKPGMFAVVFPEEGHLTRAMVEDTPKPVKKMVMKLHKSLFY